MSTSHIVTLNTVDVNSEESMMLSRSVVRSSSLYSSPLQLSIAFAQQYSYHESIVEVSVRAEVSSTLFLQDMARSIVFKEYR